jgi:kynureninase
VRFHGFDPNDAIIEVAPRKGEHTIHEEDFYKVLEEQGSEIAMVFIGGVNYYTGRCFDMENITKKGHEAGAIVGLDLAHAAGNVKLQLHDWQVDFAAWCSYKYLNSGPGSVAGIFVHEKYASDNTLKRFAGWWGHDASTRFLMEKGFQPSKGADGWQLSNAPVLSMAVHRQSLLIFQEAGLDRITEKRKKLTGYLEYVIQLISDKTEGIDLEVITPREEHRRGAQLSLLAHGVGKKLFDKLTESGVIADWREPNVIRMAPAPLYNSFTDVFEFGTRFEAALKNL